MSFKVNLIIILVVLNLLFIFVLISKKEKFNNNRAVLIDPSLKNKVKVETSVLLDNLKPVDSIKKNAELFIDGDLNIGLNTDGDFPRLCFGSKCYTSNQIEEFLRYNIPYEVFDTDPVEQKTPDALCYSIQGEKPNCITGEDLKLLNGQQSVYIAGPKYDDKTESYVNQFHLQHNKGRAPHYYYDINNNYYEKLGKRNYDSSETYTSPQCVHAGVMHQKLLRNPADYFNTGFDRVPYFYNLSKLNGVNDQIRSNIKIDEKMEHSDYTCSGDTSRRNNNTCGDGILQMVKHPVHTTKGTNYDDNNSMRHNGHIGECDGSGRQKNQIMNLAAVNLLPNEFRGDIDDPKLGRVNIRDRIKYALFPGEPTGLKCFSFT